MGYLAIAAGFAVLVILCLFNVHVMVASFAAAFVVSVLAGLPLMDSLIVVFFNRFGTIVTSLFPMFLFGAILAKLYTYSGAAASVAGGICKAMFRGGGSAKKRYALGFLTVILASAVLCYGGINAAVALIAIYPIAIGVFERAGIPKRFIMGAICGGAFTFSLSGPGSPQPTNVVAMTIGTSSYCGLVAGMVGVVVEIAVMVAVLTHLCARATARGETFVPGPKDIGLEEGPANRPKLLPALLPVVILLIVFNLLGVNIAFSILITVLAAAVIFFPQLGKKRTMEAINAGAAASLAPVGAIAGVNGFAAVVQSLPEYQQFIDGVLHASMPAVVLLIVCVSFICMMTGGSTTGIQIALPAIAPVLTRLGLSLPFIHRVGVFAATMLDSLPNSGSVIMAVGLADLKMRDGYPAVFVSTVLATTCGTLVVALVMTLFPALP